MYVCIMYVFGTSKKKKNDMYSLHKKKYQNLHL